MGDKSHFTVPHTDSDSASFKPVTKLPQDFLHLADVSSEARTMMAPELRKMLELTDLMALRSAILPQGE